MALLGVTLSLSSLFLSSCALSWVPAMSAGPHAQKYHLLGFGFWLGSNFTLGVYFNVFTLTPFHVFFCSVHLSPFLLGIIVVIRGGKRTSYGGKQKIMSKKRFLGRRRFIPHLSLFSRPVIIFWARVSKKKLPFSRSTTTTSYYRILCPSQILKESLFASFCHAQMGKMSDGHAFI